MLSKSDYLRYNQCSRYHWLYKHRPDLVQGIKLSIAEKNNIDEGNEVEAIARKLFPEGVLAKGRYEEAYNNTKEHVEAGKKVIFQATVIVDGLLAMADILQFDENTQMWNILEVKATSGIEKKHLYDTTFQKIAFERAGYEIGKICLVHVNNEFIRNGEVEPEALLIIEEITPDVKKMESETLLQIEDAKKNEQKQEEPMPRIVKQCGKGTSDQCPFVQHCWVNIPNYSVYDLNRVSESKLLSLLDIGAMDITDIPDYFVLTENQSSQVIAAKSGLLRMFMTI